MDFAERLEILATEEEIAEYSANEGGANLTEEDVACGESEEK